MKWSWKMFFVQIVSGMLLALGIAYGIGMILDGHKAADSGDSTRLAMKLGGLIAPLLLAAVGGWKAWGLKSLLISGGVVTALYSGHPGMAIVTTMISATLYLATRKAREMVFFYSSVSHDNAADQPKTKD